MSEDSKAWQQRTELLLGKDKTDRLRQAHGILPSGRHCRTYGFD